MPGCDCGSSSSSRSSATSLRFTILLHSSSSRSPAISLGFIILLLVPQLYLWGSSFFLSFLSYISEVHHSSSSRSPAISLGFIILLVPQLCLWGSPFFFLLLLVPKLYLWGSPFCVDFYVCDRVFNPTTEVATFRLRGLNVDLSTNQEWITFM